MTDSGLEVLLKYEVSETKRFITFNPSAKEFFKSGELTLFGDFELKFNITSDVLGSASYSFDFEILQAEFFTDEELINSLGQESIDVEKLTKIFE